ncbi:WbqC family protein [Carboxylicivirga sediminis]|uniref:WbqC family protein n=1 Tax=Carboxylicivirga sediminis TaxID=2006564 RepID=A0A941FD33_9BACT|nr:WbqC family protein [Carboxylicivirga sediminis]MBR8538265.1 WbqC family protein [Carboxylicivirga sediminis]
MPTTKIIPLTYLGPVQLFSHIVNADAVVIEQQANYQRKTYANRCSIAGANGPMHLAIPVTNIKGSRTSIKETVISYDMDWQKQHWRSIVSAYNSSPFFEYYADDFAPFYHKQYKYLIDFNMGLFKTMLDELELDVNIRLSDEYVATSDQPNDLRRIIHPKSLPENDKQYQTIEYRQVFAEKYSFVPNLSVIDLLFSKGPETYDILKASIIG